MGLERDRLRGEGTAVGPAPSPHAGPSESATLRDRSHGRVRFLGRECILFSVWYNGRGVPFFFFVLALIGVTDCRGVDFATTRLVS